ncbi:MAG: DUF6335 family protein [Vicinamibacterales bacterium]
MAKRKTKATRKASPTRKSGGMRAKARKPAARAKKASGRAVRKVANRRTAARRRVAARTKKPAPRAAKGSKARPVSGSVRRGPAPGLQRPRRILEDNIPTPPSSLDLDRHASAANSGRAEILEALRAHTESSPALTAGDVDADWAKAYDSGDEAPGGDNPTPDQDVVDEIGRSLGIQYDDVEELKGADKVTQRDRHRWELDPASSEDYPDRRKR